MIESIEKSRIIFLDSGPLIRLLQMHPDYYPRVSRILDFVYEKKIQVLVSSITLFEICSRAFLLKETVLARQYSEFFENSLNVRMCSVDVNVTLKAAELYANSLSTNHKLTENESIRLATAYVNGADSIITECENFRDITDIFVMTLEDNFV